jgi:hypothetical protein
MAVTQNTYTGNGSTQNFVFAFTYLDPSHVKAKVNGTLTTAFTFFNASTLRFNTAPANGAAVLIYRETPSDNLLAEYTAGGALRDGDLELTLQQVLNVSQETQTFAENQSTAGLQDQITTANNNASSALTTANSAEATANGIAGTANTALSNSNTAVSTANSAASTASSAASTANGALPRSGGTMTGALQQLAGTAAAPGLAIAGDPDTGLYGRAANELGVAVGGAPAAWFSADGLNLPAQDDVRFWDSDSSHYVGFHAPATVTTNRVWTLPATDGSPGQGLTTNGSNVLSWATLLAQGAAITAGTAVASTSGTAIDFTGIPSWVKRVTVLFNGVSTNGTANVQVQLGTASSFETTGYFSYSSLVSAPTTVAAASLTSGIATGFNAAGSARVGAITIHLLDSNTWVYTGLIGDGAATGVVHTAGVKALAGALTRLRVTTTGADTFDAGTLNIHYDG